MSMRLWGVFGALLLLAVALRSGTLLDDKTWWDEDDVVLGGVGTALAKPWPSSFQHQDVFAPSLRSVLDQLARWDAYPPLSYLTIFALRDTTNPILAARAAFLALNIGLLFLVLVWGREVATSRQALLLVAYVALSPALTLTGQQVKWYAAAPALATAASYCLFRAVRGRRTQMWVMYVAALAVLLHTHYFCAAVVIGHALFVLVHARDQLRHFAVSMLAVGVLCAPWYAFALPSQIRYVQSLLPALAQTTYTNWQVPLTPGSLFAWEAFDILAASGLQPSPVRTRYMLPLLALVLFCIARSTARGGREARATAFLGIATFAGALFAQTLVAAYIGHTIPLTWPYLTPWMPVFLTAVFLGTLDLPSRTRPWVQGILIAISFANVVAEPYPSQIRNTVSLNHFTELAGFLRTEDRPGTGIVYLDEREAKLVNIFYAGDARQLIWTVGGDLPPAEGLDRLLIVRAAQAVSSRALPGWSAPKEIAGFGDSRVDLISR